MPIKPEQRKRYPETWKEISKRIRFGRARGRCECRGQCELGHDNDVHGQDGGRCGVLHATTIRREKANGALWQFAEYVPRNSKYDRDFGNPATVTLSLAHVDRTPENGDDQNLLAMCNRCHIRFDRFQHAATAKKTRAAKRETFDPWT